MPGRAASWLEGRLAAVPPQLEEAIRSGLARHPDAGGDTVGEQLARVGLAELDRVLARAEERENALGLLAADAILTYAFEAAAELGEDVGALADEVGPCGLIGDRLRRPGGE